MESLTILMSHAPKLVARTSYFDSPNATAVYGDLPPGIVSNLVNPVSRAYQVYIVNAICIFLCTLLLAARLWSKLRVPNGLGWDDYTCIVGFIFAIFYGVNIIEMTKNGAGRHIWDVPHEWLSGYLFWNWLTNFYWISVMGSKSSFLLLYLRIFSNDKVFRYVVYFMLFFVNALNFACMWATMFVCHPVRSTWEVVPDARCYHNQKPTLAATGLALVQDVVILVLPIPLLHRLQIPTKQRLMVMGIFLTGGVATAVTAVRMWTLVVAARDTSIDYMWVDFPIYIWSIAELYVFVMVACLPLMKPVIRKFVPKWFDSSPSSPREGVSRSSFSIRKLFGQAGRSHGSGQYRDEILHKSQSQSELVDQPSPVHRRNEKDSNGLELAGAPWTDRPVAKMPRNHRYGTAEV